MRLTIACLLVVCAAGGSDRPVNYVAGPLIELNDNGAWSWFMDERAIVDGGKLIAGSVRAVGDYRNDRDPDWGNVEVSVYDLASGAIEHTVLHRHLQQDDHASPALLVLADGRYLAMYTEHGVDRRIHYRISEPHNALAWGAESVFEAPGRMSAPLRGDNVTYSNLFRLSSGRVLNFFRGVGLDPNYMYSDDSGRTWRYGGRVAHGKGGYSPYLKYAFDGAGTIYFVMTEDHPRNYDNSLYAGFVRDSGIYLSDGTLRGRLSQSTSVKINAWDLTKVFHGDPDNVAWMSDVERHHELYRGTTRDFGATWRWEPLTANSTVDNLRPIVPRWKDSRTALVWMRGSYKNNHGEWTTAVVATILPPAADRHAAGP